MINTKRFDRVDQRKQQLDELRPLPPATARTLHEALVLEWTYHSNAIEGNTLTLNETKVVFEGIKQVNKLAVKIPASVTNRPKPCGTFTANRKGKANKNVRL